MYRLIGVGAFLLWVTAMVSLVVRDILPAWTAKDPPHVTGEQFKLLDEPNQQFGVVDAKNRRVGTVWSDVTHNPGNGTTSITAIAKLDKLPIIPPIRIFSSTDFDSNGAIESFRMNVVGVLNQRMHIHGERWGIYFPVEMQFGPIRRETNLDYAATRLIGESLHPFAYLPTLRVGQSWRMQVLDPVAVVLGNRADFKPVVATVTRKETIAHPTEAGRSVECFVVETSPTPSRAWVDAKGHVFRQETDLPGFGRITLVKEAYNAQQRRDARAGRDEAGNDLRMGE